MTSISEYLRDEAASCAVPILGIPCLNRPDLLLSCLRSIDTSVGMLLIIDNSEESLEDAIADELDANDYVRRWHVIKPLQNMGVAASWNAIIKAWPAAPWWAIANADTVFGGGDLQRLSFAMAEAGDTARWIGMNGDWRVFGISPECIERVGWFDENFHPIYCEDADYEWRCTIEGVRYTSIRGTTTHAGSACWVGDAKNTESNARTYPEQVAYYASKWGTPPRAGERFVQPFAGSIPAPEPGVQLHRLVANAWD